MIAVNELTPRSVDWLWPNRLALGKLAMFDGDAGLGKSLVTLDLCARVTTGRPFPDGAAGGEPASVVVLNAEDGARDTIHGRLRAAGADLSRVHVFDRSEAERSFARELGAAWAGDTAKRSPEPLAAIIDTTPAWTPIVEALAKVRTRVGAIYGEFDAPANPNLDERAALLRSIVPDIDFRVIRGAGHWTAYEAADQFNATLEVMLRAAG